MSHWNAHLYDTSLKYVADYGKELVALLNPKKDERILDLGCGTGDLTIEIAQKGAHVIGLDNSETMLRRAREKYPKIEFMQGDAIDFKLEEPVDAVFSNAVLHWVTQQEMAVKNIYASLKKGGRFVAELGGKGNVHKIIESIQNVIAQAGYKTVDFNHVFYFPSIGDYATLLEKTGFQVEASYLFERPTLILNGEAGFRDWVNVFGILFFQNVPSNKKDELIAKAVEGMMKSLEKDDRYFADYVRLRVLASKV
jgi:trans-aconitate methyltransferase